MESEGSLLHFQIPTTCPYPDPDQFSPYPPSHILKIHLNIILPFMPRSSKWFFPSVFSTKTLYAPLFSPISATCPAYLILLNLTTRTILGEYKSFSSSLWWFLHSPITSSLLGPNILLNTLFSNTLSLHSSLSVSDHVHTHINKQAKLQFCIF